MKFSIDDPVYIVSNQEEGRIVEFIGADMAKVMVNNSVYHVYLEDLEHPYLRWFQQKSKNITAPAFGDQIRPEKAGRKTSGLEDGHYLLFFPVYQISEFDERIEKCRIYLLNESDRKLSIRYLCRIGTLPVFELGTEIIPHTELYLHDLNFEQLASSPSFQVHLRDSSKESMRSDSESTLKARKLQIELDKLQEENKAFFYLPLSRDLKEETGPYPDDIHHKVAHKTPQRTIRTEKRKSPTEVDLHIDRLLPEYRGLSASEILNIQLKACRDALDLAIITHQQQLILIHGIGNGVLKQRIFEILNQTHQIREYVNEFDHRYGYGATKVIFHG